MGQLPDTIGLIVSDDCGTVLSARAATQSTDPPNLRLPDKDLTACWGETLDIPTELTGFGPFTLSYRVNGGPVEMVRLEDSTDYRWADSRGGTYQVIRVQDQACGRDVNELAEITLYRPALRIDYEDPSCYGFSDGTLTIDHLRTVGPYSYRINDRQLDGPTASDLAAGSYLLTVTGAAGCEDSTSMELFEPKELLPVTFTCADLRRRPLRLTARGGQAPYAYSVDGQNFDPDLWDDLRGGDTYQLTIRDAAGCELEQPQFYYPASNRQWVRLNNFYTQEVGGSIKLQPYYFLPPQQFATYSWSPAEMFDCPTCPDPTITAPYTQDVALVVQDIFGCVDSVGATVAVDGSSPLFVPNVFTPDGDGSNDFMTVFANPDLVSEIISFRIYTRWGEMVFSDENFPPNSDRRGWDGYLNDRIGNSGSYLWTVQFRLYDGEVIEQAGTTILMRR